jgi:hypothetical protein
VPKDEPVPNNVKLPDGTMGVSKLPSSIRFADAEPATPSPHTSAATSAIFREVLDMIYSFQESKKEKKVYL